MATAQERSLLQQLINGQIDKDTYERMMGTLSQVDLSEIIESEDETDLKGELACAGGSCEIVWLDSGIIP